MSLRDASRAGHWPTLICAVLGFDLCFMVWVLLGPLGAPLATSFGLSAGQQSLVAALPFVVGALLCPLFGTLADRIGGRRLALGTFALTMVPLLFGWLVVKTYPQLLVLSALLGVAGASFAVILPLASRWYSSEYQGLILGLVGMGTGGSALAAVFVPSLVPAVGWNGVFALALIPIGTLLLFSLLLVKDAPSLPAPRPLREVVSLVGVGDIARCACFYFLTLGGFVGLSLFLPLFLKQQYGVDPIRASVFAGFCSIFGSMLRPVGGYLADRLGGVPMLFLCFLSVGFLGMRMSYLPHLDVATLCLFLCIALLGIGNGAVFQLVPLHFQEWIGLGTGLVGGAGALGCFLVPLALGASYQWTGRFGPGFFYLGLVGFIATGFLIQASRDWYVRLERFSDHARPLPKMRERGAVVEVAMDTMPR